MGEKRRMFADISRQASAFLYSTHPPFMQIGPTWEVSNVRLKSKAKAMGSTTFWDGKQLREEQAAVLYLWTLACETQNRTLQWVYLSPNQDMIWVVQED